MWKPKGLPIFVWTDLGRRFKHLYALIDCKINNKFETANEFARFYADNSKRFVDYLGGWYGEMEK